MAAAHRQPSFVRVALVGVALVGAGLLLLAAAWGPGTARAFTGPTNFPAGTNPRSVAVGDFNGDSRPDLAVANTDSDDVSIMLGDGGGGFKAAPGSPVPVGTTPQSVAVGDFNGDAHADLAVANTGSNDVSILLGNGGGQFVPALGGSVATGASPISIAVADFNGDSDPDLAIANYGSNGVSIMLGGAGASFAPALGSPLVAGSSPFSIAVGNFNGDSDPDLAVANSGSNDVSILLGAAGGSFTPAPGSPLAAGTSPQSVAVGDFNGDSRADLAVANHGSDAVSVLLGSGGGGFAPAPGGPLAAGTGPTAVAVADFNRDSDPDLAVVNESSGNVFILLGSTGSSFTAAPGGPIVASIYPEAIAVGDFNRDSAPDFAVTNSGTDNVSVLLSGTGTSFRPTAGSPVPAGANPRSIAAGDFNGDSYRDLAVANNGSNDVSILLGGAGGAFTQAAGSPVSAGNAPFSVTVGDFNGDSRADLAVANIGSNDVTILLGNGSGGFATAAGSPIPVGGGPVWVTVCRFNGDALPDLAVANLTSNDVSILLGNGAGGFAPAAGSPVPVGAGPISVAVGDFNGDSRADLVVGNSSSDDVSILLGNGAGSFLSAPGSPVPAGNYPHMVAVGDFNRDSRADVAVVNYESDNFSILLGNGSAGFAPAPGSPFAVGTCPESIAIADFNGDSHLDVVVANEHSGNLSLLFGASNGSFTAAPGVSLPAGTTPIALQVGNFNGDSRPDLAVASYTTAGVWILLGSAPPKSHHPHHPGRGKHKHHPHHRHSKR
jgi:hypothetical protein